MFPFNDISLLTCLQKVEEFLGATKLIKKERPQILLQKEKEMPLKCFRCIRLEFLPGSDTLLDISSKQYTGVEVTMKGTNKLHVPQPRPY